MSQASSASHRVRRPSGHPAARANDLDLSRFAYVEDAPSAARVPGRDDAARRPREVRDSLRADGGLATLPTPRRPLLGPDGGEIAARPNHPFKTSLFDGRGWRALRMLSDLLAACIAVAVSARLANSGPAADAVTATFPLLVVAALAVRGLYGRRMRVVFLDTVGPLVGGVSVAAMALLALNLVTTSDPHVGARVGEVWALAIVLLCCGRALLTHLQTRARARLEVSKVTLIVGAGMVGAQVARRLGQHPEYGLLPVGFLDADPLAAEAADRALPVLGSPDELSETIDATGAEHVILAFSAAADRKLVSLVRLCEERGVEVSLVPRLFESINDRVGLERLGGLPLLGLRAIDPKGWQFQVKYTLDRPLSLLLLLVLWPLLLGAALAVRFGSPGPVLFRQRRVGQDGRTFDLFKFRSMRIDDESDSFLPVEGAAPGGIEGRDRRTRVGRFLRRSGIDELPQLFNVLRGEMSIVGPRPERPEFVEVFAVDHDRYSDRHRVKSGITGWSQVHGLRGQTSLSDRIEWDNFYIENWSLWLDLKVCLMTLGALLRSNGDA